MPVIDTSNLYKYRLKELFIRLFGDKAPEQKDLFCRQIGLTDRTLTSDFNARYGSDYVIPEERLLQYAQFLNLPVEALRLQSNNSLVA